MTAVHSGNVGFKPGLPSKELRMQWGKEEPDSGESQETFPHPGSQGQHQQ